MIQIQLVGLAGLAAFTVAVAYFGLIHKGVPNHVLTRLEAMIYGMLVVSVGLFILVYTTSQ